MGAGGELFRERLIRRILSRDVRFIGLFAAAGYGKTTLARQVASAFSSVCVCDFRDAQSLRDVAQRIAIALAPDPQIATQAAAPIDTDAVVFFDFAKQLWTQPGPQVAILENAETLSRIDGAERALGNLLSATPPERRVCICSRTALDLRFLDFALPHEVVVVGERDLAFDREDVAQFLDSENSAIETLYDLTRGWPLCVRLVARLVEMRGADALVRELRSVDFSLLYEYLLENVIAVLEPLNRSVAIALGAADLNNDDLRRLFGERASEAIGFARQSPFIGEHGNYWTIHPLIRASIQRSYLEETSRILHDAAGAALREDPVRAAMLYAQASDFEGAADALEHQALAYVSEGSNPDFAVVLQQLPHDVLLRHPRLFASAMTFAGLGVSNEERYRTAYAIRQQFDGSEDETTRVSIDVTIANALTNLGRHEEAAKYVEAFAHAPNAAGKILYHMLYGGILARMGRYVEAMTHWEPLKRLACDAPSTLAFGANEIAVRAARSRGDVAAEREYHAFALANARKSKNPTAHVLTVIEGLFGAWLRGDENEFSSLAEELRQLRFPSIMPGTRLLRSCVDGDLRDLKADVARPQVHAYAYLLALRIARGELQRRIAEMACEAADRANEPFLQCVSRVGLSFADASSYSRALAQAQNFASRVESTQLHDAVEQLTRGLIAPMFATLAAGITDIAIEEGRYRLLLLERALFLGKSRINASKREIELLAYLGFRDGEVSRDELAEAFAPSATSSQADHLIRVTVSRIRKKFGENLLVSTRRGYVLGPSVDVPLRDMRRRIERCETQSSLTAADLGALVRDMHRIRLYLEGRRFEYEWAEELDTMLEDLLVRMERLTASGGAEMAGA
jgi:DNA-binding winged helix-turn-helix (wHTH) protein